VLETREAFAPSAFKNLKDEEKLSSASYTEEVSGAVMEEDSLRCSYGINRELAYDSTISDFDPFPSPLANFRPFNLKLFRAFIKGGDIGRSALSKQNQEKHFRKDGAVKMGEEVYSVVNTDTLAAHAGGFTAGSKAEAEAA